MKIHGTLEELSTKLAQWHYACHSKGKKRTSFAGQMQSCFDDLPVQISNTSTANRYLDVQSCSVIEIINMKLTYSTAHKESTDWIEVRECLQRGESVFCIRIEVSVHSD